MVFAVGIIKVGVVVMVEGLCDGDGVMEDVGGGGKGRWEATGVFWLDSHHSVDREIDGEVGPGPTLARVGMRELAPPTGENHAPGSCSQYATAKHQC